MHVYKLIYIYSLDELAKALDTRAVGRGGDPLRWFKPVSRSEH